MSEPGSGLQSPASSMHEGDVDEPERPPLTSAAQSVLEYRMIRRNTGSISSYASRGDENDLIPEDDALTPPFLSSPSAASSLVFSGYASPLRRELSKSTLQNEIDMSAPSGRLGLARRLSHLAKQLTDGEEMDEMLLGNQVNQMERAMMQSPTRSKSTESSSASRHMQRRSDQTHSVGGSPRLSRFGSSYSESRGSRASTFAESSHGEEPSDLPTNKPLTARQANKVIAEVSKLNEELTVVVENLMARQEESDHIHNLLIERAERAAQRIIFLQNRISYLEQELRDNDDELQHLRICLKAVEIQLPPHPDEDLQRCIAVFKEDYKTLKKRRADRASTAGYDSSFTTNNESTLLE